MIVDEIKKDMGIKGSNRHLVGRTVIYTDANDITLDTVANELSNALAIHNRNAIEIDYLDKVYRGWHDIKQRQKQIRPEVNNKVTVNIPYQVVEFFTGQDAGEPIQYIRRGEDESISSKINTLNTLMATENKGAVDIERTRWAHICGTSYAYVYVDNMAEDFDEAPFGLESLDPRETFVVYNSGDGKKPLFTVTKRTKADGYAQYIVFTRRFRFAIPSEDNNVKNGIGTNDISVSVNGLKQLPIIEYPNNERRLSTIEMVLDLCDAVDKLQSDRLNSVEQFVQALMIAKNCRIDEKQYDAMRQRGFVNIKSNQGGADADITQLDTQLDQTVTQTLKLDFYNDILNILGMPTNEKNTGGDTGAAVQLRNNWTQTESRALLREPFRKKAELQMLKVVFTILKSKGVLDLKISDIDIKITRSKTDNMSVKANVLVLLLKAGIDYQTAVRTCDLWSDPEDVALKSQPNFVRIYEENKLNNGNGLKNITIE